METTEKENADNQEELETEKRDQDTSLENKIELDTTTLVSEQQTQSNENVTYNEDGVAVYTDPTTKFKYIWSASNNKWEPQGGSSTDCTNETIPLENEHYRWCEETKKWILKESKLENEYYRWCEKTNQWIPKMKNTENVTYNYDADQKIHTYTDADGCVYVWDAEKSAWFPRVDDDFLALYQLNYGFVDNTSKESAVDNDKKTETPENQNSNSEENKTVELTGTTGGRKRKPPPKWFEINPEQNSKVYVSNLPLDMTEEEFGELMSKCGLIMRDVKSHKLKIKLYRDQNGEMKGDGLCHYIKVESVELALNVLDGYEVRGKNIKVERAKFEMRGEYNPALKPKMTKSEKKKLKETQQKLFDWRPEKMRGERSKHERTVIIKNLFDPSIFDNNVELILEYQNDLREECTKCGTVRKVVIHDRHPEGVAQITMADPEEADLVVQLLNARFYADRRLLATTWDGKTKYKIEETEEERKQRLSKWSEFITEDTTPTSSSTIEKMEDSTSETSIEN